MPDTSDSREEILSRTCVVCAVCGVDIGIVVYSPTGSAGVSLKILNSLRFNGWVRRLTLKCSVGVSLKPSELPAIVPAIRANLDSSRESWSSYLSTSLVSPEDDKSRKGARNVPPGRGDEET